jgi:acyl-CoA reductase-like NAD-dependent aldehyde dehydrogenase
MRGDGVDLRFGRTKILVGDKFVRAERERVIDPATGEVIAEVPRCAEELARLESKAFLEVSAPR